jgi:hypothetical protein
MQKVIPGFRTPYAANPTQGDRRGTDPCGLHNLSPSHRQAPGHQWLVSWVRSSATSPCSTWVVRTAGRGHRSQRGPEVRREDSEEKEILDIDRL